MVEVPLVQAASSKGREVAPRKERGAGPRGHLAAGLMPCVAGAGGLEVSSAREMNMGVIC